MLLASWKQIVHFKPGEFDDPDFPGSGIHINHLLVMLLDKLRITIGCPIITHWKVGGCVDMKGTHGHTRNSYHLYDWGAKACDFHIKTNMGLREQYNHVCRAGFGGIVVYPWWNNPGFHVDVRPIHLTNHMFSPTFQTYNKLFP